MREKKPEKIVSAKYHDKDDLGGGQMFWELSRRSVYLVEGKKLRKL